MSYKNGMRRPLSTELKTFQDIDLVPKVGDIIWKFHKSRLLAVLVSDQPNVTSGACMGYYLNKPFTKKLVNFENAIRCEQDDFNEKAILLKKETTYTFRNSHLRENLAYARKLYEVPAHERIDRLMAEKFPRVDGTIQLQNRPAKKKDQTQKDKKMCACSKRRSDKVCLSGCSNRKNGNFCTLKTCRGNERCQNRRPVRNNLDKILQIYQ